MSCQRVQSPAVLWKFVVVLVLLICHDFKAAAQRSHGFTLWTLATSGSKDAQGNTITAPGLGRQTFITDGTRAVFLDRLNGAVNCGINWTYYSVPLTGGTITPIVTVNSKLDSSQADGTVSYLCVNPILSKGNLVFGGAYLAGGQPTAGVYQIPLAGGTAHKLLQTGDTFGGQTVANVNVGAQLNTTMIGSNPTLAGASGGAATLFDFTNPQLSRFTYFDPGSGAASSVVDTSQTCTTGKIPWQSTVIVTPPQSNVTGTDGTVYATMTGGSVSGTLHSVFLSSSTPDFNGCEKLLWDPAVPDANIDPTSTVSGHAPRLPGAPLPNTPGSAAQAAATFTWGPVVANGIVYTIGTQTIANYTGPTGSLMYYALLSIDPSSKQVTKLVSNLDALPGFTPSTTPCNGNVAPVTLSSLAAAGDYIVFRAAQEVANGTACSGKTIGGLFVYRISTGKVFSILDATNDPAQLKGLPSPYVSSLSNGVLTADGHLLYSTVDAVSNGTPSASTLYSLYLGQRVSSLALGVSSSSVTFSSTVTLTAAITPRSTAAQPGPTGTVHFFEGNTELGTAELDFNGNATLSLSSLKVGSHTIYASYDGDTLFQGADSASSTITVTPYATTLDLTPADGATFKYPTSPTFAAKLPVAGGVAPTGSVNFVYNSLPAPLPGGAIASDGSASAVLPLTLVSPGKQTITASYAGDANYAPVSVKHTFYLTIDPTLSGTFSPSAPLYGQSVVLTVAGSNTQAPPTGSLSYSVDGGASLSSVFTNGSAALNLGMLTAGTHAVSVQYAGDNTYTAASQQYSISVGKATLTIKANDATRTYGSANPTLSGTITGAVPADGITASYATNATATSTVGSYDIVPSVADPNGKIANYSMAVTNGTLKVTQATSSTVLTVSASSVALGTPVTLSAKVASSTTGTPTGNVAFFNGQTSLGTAAINATGVATFSFTPSGAATTTYTLTAAYGGDTNFSGSQSAAASVTAGAPDYTIAASPSSATIKAGDSATFTFTVTPSFGFNTPITFGCSALPAFATCTFTPATVTPNGAPVTATLVVRTSVTTASSISGMEKGFAVALLLLPAALFRRKSVPLMLCVLVSAVLLGAAGCGGGDSSQKTVTPVGTSNVVVSATASGTSNTSGHTANITLTIQ